MKGSNFHLTKSPITQLSAAPRPPACCMIRVFCGPEIKLRSDYLPPPCAWLRPSDARHEDAISLAASCRTCKASPSTIWMRRTPRPEPSGAPVVPRPCRSGVKVIEARLLLLPPTHNRFLGPPNPPLGRFSGPAERCSSCSNLGDSNSRLFDGVASV